MDITVLRAMIEQNGLFDVLDTISGICGKMAESQNKDMDWETAETIIDAAASAILNLSTKDDPDYDDDGNLRAGVDH